MSEQKHYASLKEAVDNLTASGFKHQFSLKEGKLVANGYDGAYGLDDVEVVENHRFEGTSNPADMSIVFAIATKDGEKGTFVDAYGTYTDPQSADFVRNMLKK